MRTLAATVLVWVRLLHRIVADDEVVVEELELSIAQEQIIAAAPRRGCHIGPENRDDYGESHDH